jgi:hypothetical protein
MNKKLPLEPSHLVDLENQFVSPKMTRHNDKRFNSPYSPLDRLVGHHGQELVILHCKCKKIMKCYRYNASKVKWIVETRVYIFQCSKWCHHIFER